MMQVHQITYNPFAENTFVISDETNECIIIDPGCYFQEERQHLKQFIEEKGLVPVKVVNTHCHLDHVFGVAFVTSEWDLEWGYHKVDEWTLQGFERSAQMYGVTGYQVPPEAGYFISENDKVEFGNSSLDVIFVPGHCVGHIAFVSYEDNFVINGDVLFNGSIGRWDLPGGDFNTLKKSIEEVMFKLPDEMVVCCGHGPQTTIGHEKMTNPILKMPFKSN